MAKIRTLTQLQESLDAGMSWRVKEISDFKLVTKAQSDTSPAFIRAGVALVYAHWEGFIKAARRTTLTSSATRGTSTGISRPVSPSSVSKGDWHC